jgi:2-succinyl-5-enolpyruvyl-6-hydroxy-3-cyclohexene-1-carboxylate synthase
MHSAPHFDSLSLSNINSAVGAFVFEVLARLGVEAVVTSPGSRSTPLTFAASRNSKLDTVSILDERSAGFFALGRAKASCKPVVLICTSGTAAANFLPAIIEAQLSKVPLIVFTADRPLELRHCSAGQVIDQVKLFGDHVSLFRELAEPKNTHTYFEYIRQTLVHVVHHSMGLQAGPQHLNFSFREPLSPDKKTAPIVSAEDLNELANVVVKLSDSSHPKVSIEPLLLEKLVSHRKGIILVGTYESNYQDALFVEQLAIISKKLGWPILSDVLNPSRNHSNHFSTLITHYDAFLRDSHLAHRLFPAAILQIGKLPTSKVLSAWIQASNAQRFLLNESYENRDPLHGLSVPLLGDLETLSGRLAESQMDAQWVKDWSASESLYEQSIEEDMLNMSDCFEGKIAHILSTNLPSKSAVFLANSMSVRYAESFWKQNNSQYRIFFNRGANGIDGTLSTALGVAHKGVHTILLTGDLAFLHDSNGLLFAANLKGSLTVIIVNNGGGGIFEHLPISEHESFEEFFATPQNVCFQNLSNAHKLSYVQLTDLAKLTDLLNEEFTKGVRIIEILTDRKLDAELFYKLNQKR